MDQEEEIRHGRIERYLDGMMEGRERAVFEQQIQVDSTLEQALQDEILVRAAMRRMQENELRAKIRHWREDPDDKRPFFLFNAAFWRDWRTWLLILLAAGLLAWFFYPRKKTEPVQPPVPETSSENIPPPPTPTLLPAASDNPSAPQAARQPVRTERKNKPRARPPAPEKEKLAIRAVRDNLVRAVRDSITSTVMESFAQSRATNSISNRPTKSADGDTLSGSAALIVQADRAIQDRAFTEALRLLRQADSTDAEVRLKTAEALFGDRRYAESAPLFRGLSDHLLYGIDARKNLVLCYLAQFPREQETFQQELDTLLKSQSPTLSGWAKALKNELDKLR